MKNLKKTICILSVGASIFAIANTASASGLYNTYSITAPTIKKMNTIYTATATSPSTTVTTSDNAKVKRIKWTVKYQKNNSQSEGWLKSRICFKNTSNCSTWTGLSGNTSAFKNQLYTSSNDIILEVRYRIGMNGGYPVYDLSSGTYFEPKSATLKVKYKKD